MSNHPLRNVTWPMNEDPTEMWSRRILIGAFIAGCLGWYMFFVRPNNAMNFAILECVGDRAPTEPVVKACAAQVQP